MVQAGCTLWLLIALLSGGAANAQEAGPEKAKPEGERIYFSALTREEKPKLGLSEGDFSLRINGRRTALKDFRPGLPHTDRSIPLAAWMLLDWSPDVNARLMADQASAASGFFDLLHPDSVIGVKLVSDRAETVAPLARDPQALTRGFAQFSRTRTELRVVPGHETVFLGPEGILRAIDVSVTDLNDFILSDPRLRGQEVRRAIIIISAANLNPSYDARPVVKRAAGYSVFLYPVFIPGRLYGVWLERYFDLAKRTAGVASTFGALNPGSRVLDLERPTLGPNALTFNLIHVVRDLNGKYSFEAPAAAGKTLKLDLKSRARNVQIRLPRKEIQ